MRFLRKISPPPYVDSMHNVMAYSGEEDEEQVQQQEESELYLSMPKVEVDTTGTQWQGIGRQANRQQRLVCVQEDGVNFTSSLRPILNVDNASGSAVREV